MRRQLALLHVLMAHVVRIAADRAKPESFLLAAVNPTGLLAG